MATDQSVIAVPQFIVGKVLLLQLSPSNAVLTDTRFETIGGRVFAVGISPWGSSPETKDKTLAVPWDQVQQFYVYDSVEEWLAASRVWESEKRKAKADAKPKSWFSFG